MCIYYADLLGDRPRANVVSPSGSATSQTLRRSAELWNGGQGPAATFRLRRTREIVGTVEEGPLLRLRLGADLLGEALDFGEDVSLHQQADVLIDDLSVPKEGHVRDLLDVVFERKRLVFVDVDFHDFDPGS